MSRVSLDRAGDEIAHEDATRLAVHRHEVEHFTIRKGPDGALLDLPHHRLIRAEQELLTGLAARVKRPRHLRAPKGTIVEQSAVLTREGNTLRDTLVDDVDAQL